MQVLSIFSPCPIELIMYESRVSRSLESSVKNSADCFDPLADPFPRKLARNHRRSRHVSRIRNSVTRFSDIFVHGTFYIPTVLFFFFFSVDMNGARAVPSSDISISMEYRWKIDSLIPPMICRFLKIRGNSIRGCYVKMSTSWCFIFFFLFFFGIGTRSIRVFSDGEKASRNRHATL